MVGHGMAAGIEPAKYGQRGAAIYARLFQPFDCQFFRGLVQVKPLGELGVVTFSIVEPGVVAAGDIAVQSISTA